MPRVARPCGTDCVDPTVVRNVVHVAEQRSELPGGYSYSAYVPPINLDHAQRAELVSVSDAAFGTDSSDSWERRFEGSFFEHLKCLYLIFDPDDTLVGWSSYRAETIAGDRVVYFVSTGLSPRHQGRGLIPVLHGRALEHEQASHPSAAVTLVVRTRNPAAYRLMMNTPRTEPVIPDLNGRVPPTRLELVTETAQWLEQDQFDPTTSRCLNAYADRPALYGADGAPVVSDPAITQLFASLGPNDAFLLFARMAKD